MTGFEPRKGEIKKGKQSNNGSPKKSCHQCRQNTWHFKVGCKNMRKNKLCSIKLCHKCLSNRYGEEAEKVSLLEDWKCPKCRGICNCSVCMTKRGCQPTGQLVHTAKANGYSSVSDMLQYTGTNNSDQIKALKERIGSQKKIIISNNVKNIVSSENSSALSKNSSDKQSTGCKRKKVNEKPDDILSKDDVVNDLDRPHDGENKPKSEFDSKRGDVASVKETLSEECQYFIENNKERYLKEVSVKDDTTLTPFPQGTVVTAIGDIDFQPEDVGNALQFLEFCVVFGKILDIKKGQPEAVLSDILQGRRSRYGEFSLTIQFLSNLLSFLKDKEKEKSSAETLTEGKNSWYADIKMLISKSHSVSKTMGLESLGNDVEDFENLNPTEKLKLLNFMCDEVLETVKIRDWIDDENSNFALIAKEAKKKVAAAKDEKKRLKQKMTNEIAQAIIAKNGAPLSISEHEAIVSQIKREVAEGHASVVESKNTYSKLKRWKILPFSQSSNICFMRSEMIKRRSVHQALSCKQKDCKITDNQISEAVRMEPLFSGTDGKVYWTLKCYGDKSILLCQDVGTGDTAASNEKWFAFDAKQKEIIEKRIINSLREKRKVRTPKVQQKLPSQDDEATPQDVTDFTCSLLEECNG